MAALAYNGETYNYAEIRSELRGRGHRFHSTGDTEVIVLAYLEWGPSFLSRIRGMFALALWDDHRKELVLARDRLGR